MLTAIQPDRAAAGDDLFGARRCQHAVGGVPGHGQPAFHHAVEQRDGPGVVFEQIVVQPHDVTDPVVALQNFQLVEDRVDAALAHADAVEIADAAKGALGAAAAVRQRGGKLGAGILEAIERANGAVVRIGAQIHQVISRDHGNGLRRGLACAGEPQTAGVVDHHLAEGGGCGLAAHHMDEIHQ